MAAMAVASSPKIVRPTSTCLVRKVQKVWPSQKLMNLECRLRVRNLALRQIGASRKVRKEQSNLLPLPRNLHFLDMNNCSIGIRIPEVLSMSPFSSKHEFLLNPKMLKRCDPWILRVYELPVTTMLRLQDLMCPQLCHAPINKQAVLMGELPHPSHLVSGKHSSSIPHSCSPIDGLVHPNSWPFTPIMISITTAKPKAFVLTQLISYNSFVHHLAPENRQRSAEGAFFLCLHVYLDVSFPQQNHLNARARKPKASVLWGFYEIIAIARFLDVLMICMILLMGCPSPYLSESESADKMETSTLWGRSHLLGSLQFRNMSLVHDFFIPELKQKCCTPIYAVRTIIFP